MPHLLWNLRRGRHLGITHFAASFPCFHVATCSYVWVCRHKISKKIFSSMRGVVECLLSNSEDRRKRLAPSSHLCSIRHRIGDQSGCKCFNLRRHCKRAPWCTRTLSSTFQTLLSVFAKHRHTTTSEVCIFPMSLMQIGMAQT
jgi:hypothetical protein